MEASAAIAFVGVVGEAAAEEFAAVVEFAVEFVVVGFVVVGFVVVGFEQRLVEVEAEAGEIFGESFGR